MILSSLALTLGLSALAAAAPTPSNSTLSTTDFPMIDLGYAVHQATSYNVPSHYFSLLFQLHLTQLSGILRRLHLLQHSFRRSPHWLPPFCRSPGPAGESHRSPRRQQWRNLSPRSTRLHRQRPHTRGWGQRGLPVP
jgi:hypothetical protein